MEFQAQSLVIGNTLQIRYYGIIIVFAMLVAAFVASRLAKRDQQDPDHIWGALTWAIIPAIIGARLWAILFPSASAGHDTMWYLQNFFDPQQGAIAIWSGGLSVFGAVIGGALGGFLYVRRHKLNVWQYLDYAGIVLPLGQAIGRVANYVNQELYGVPTNLPWGITIGSQHRVEPFRSLVDYPLDTRFHPLFLYEALWNLGLFFLLVWLFNRKRKSLRYGDFFLIYVMAYSFVRFFLEFIRADVPSVGGINPSQGFTLLAFVVAGVIFLYRYTRMPSAGEEPVARTLMTKSEKAAAEDAKKKAKAQKQADKAAAKAGAPPAAPAAKPAPKPAPPVETPPAPDAPPPA
jgi:phosphatidylglycerol:prolipoprotein diacylglycerol transferase